MTNIPEDYTHAQLWMKYKHYQKKLEAVKTLMNTEAVTLWFPSKDEDTYLYDILKGIKNILEGEEAVE